MPTLLYAVFIVSTSCIHDFTCYSCTMFIQTFGAVNDAIIMEDKETKRSRGFGFVTMGICSFMVTFPASKWSYCALW